MYVSEVYTASIIRAMMDTFIALMMEAVRTLKCRYTSKRQHGAISQNAVIFTLAAVRT
jgi:hypothetical protein